jgi:predicted aspartyl protease
MRGSVDGLGRPLLRLTISGRGDDIISTVDTGFNGELLMSETDARQLGIVPLSVEGRVTLGDGSQIFVKQAITTLFWLGLERHVRIQLTTTVGPVQKLPSQTDDPIALIGTTLITPNILEIDFGAKTVAIFER